MLSNNKFLLLKYAWWVLSAVFILLGIASIQQYYTLQNQTPQPISKKTNFARCTQHDCWTREIQQIAPLETSPGLTLIVTSKTPQIELIDNTGAIIKTWHQIAHRAHLLDNCNLLTNLNSIKEYNLNESINIEHSIEGENFHHDLLKNKTGEIYAISENDTQKKIKIKNVSYNVIEDAIIKFDSNNQQAIKWNFSNSWKPFTCGLAPCQSINRDFFYSHMDSNLLDWTHANSIDLFEEETLPTRLKNHPEFLPGNLLITARNITTIFILDILNNKVLWTLDQRDLLNLTGPHEAKLIPKDFPGEGNIIFLDNSYNDPNGRYYFNGKYAVPARVIEIDPLTKKIVWEYSTPDLMNDQGGSAQRLKNGNTLISLDYYGQVLEVDPNKKIVWRYQHNKQINWVKKYEQLKCLNLITTVPFKTH